MDEAREQAGGAHNKEGGGDDKEKYGIYSTVFRKDVELAAEP